MVEIKSFEDRKKELLDLGKKNGFITFEQLADKLKGLDMDSDSLDDLYNFLSENNIDGSRGACWESQDQGVN